MGRDEWRFNYLGMFLSVSGIIIVLTCALIAYNLTDNSRLNLDGASEVAASTLPPPTITIQPSTTTTTSTTSTTLAPNFEERNRQDFLNVVNDLMAQTAVRLVVF